MERKLILLLTVLCIFFTGCTDYEAQIEQLTTQVSTLEKSLEDKQVLIDSKDTEIDELKENIQSLTNELTTVKSELSSLQTTHSQCTVNTTYTAPSQNTKSNTVYVTRTGSKYHRYGCQYLKNSCISKSLSDAQSQGYTPCSKCW